MSEKDGGPAFPLQFASGDGELFFNDGMSLRDWFAGQALPGVISSMRGAGVPAGCMPEDLFAQGAYMVADAMIRASKL